ncbi:prohibitin family protein [Desulfonema magnum]|uniref:SPFH domain-containing protein n=1 Tax=Desulfonema magnum TaxID=45655 RepID=A0A975BXQ1_9BACT|nr:prohibitin family protein [Desulfonema magnum]QTA93676.1 SPFH domain-containing protein [Desulfonema magnum]
MIIDKILEFMTMMAWLLFAVLTIIFLVRNTRKYGIKAAIRKLFSFQQLLIALVLIIMLNFLSASLVFVQPHEIGVVVSALSAKGIRNQPIRPGLRWILPLAERTAIYPVFCQTYTMSGKPAEGQHFGDDSIRARTSDGQEVILDCSIIFQIDSEKVVQFHIDWQHRYIRELVRPTVRGVIRTYVSQYTVDEVNSKSRIYMGLTLSGKLRRALSKRGLIVKNFLLRNLAFSSEYSSSVEQKQVALEGEQQKKYEAKQIENLAKGHAKKITIQAKAEADAILLKAKAKAEAHVIRAKAEADALKLLAAVLAKNPDLLTYQHINELPQDVKVMLLPDKTAVILPLPRDMNSGKTLPFSNPFEIPISPQISVKPTGSSATQQQKKKIEN